MNPRLFIIEGPDCSGKSTLARHLAAQKDAVYIHASGAKSLHSVMQDYHKSLLAIAVANLELGRNVVMDRFWPSEVVYGSILRPIEHNKYDADWFIAGLAALDTTYVFCDDSVVIDRHAEQQDSDHPYGRGLFASIVRNYQRLTIELADSKSPVFHVRRYNVVTDGKTMGTFVDSL